MTGRRAIFGLCMLCAMAFSAIAAQGAWAGQTSFTCVEVPSGGSFSSEHCVEGETGTTWAHVVITPGEVTHAKLSNAKTDATTTGPENTVLKETIAATNLELESTGVVEGLGTLENKEVAGEMTAYAESDANGITFHGVKVIAPANKGCVVRESSGGTLETVKTKPVKGHTIVRTDKENGEGTAAERHSVIIEPVTGETFATFFIECTGNVPLALKGNWEINGKLRCPTHGATIVCNHQTVTETEPEGGLIGKGATAGLKGKATITAGKLPVTEPTHPISVTTTTP